MKVKRISNIDGGNINIGEICNVYAMSLWKGSLNYLLGDGPYWYSAKQFEIIEKFLPIIWYFNFMQHVDAEGKISNKAIWGYKEIACDKNHYIDLIERESEALDIFLKRKKELDELEDLGIKKPISENSYS